MIKLMAIITIFSISTISLSSEVSLLTKTNNEDRLKNLLEFSQKKFNELCKDKSLDECNEIASSLAKEGKRDIAMSLALEICQRGQTSKDACYWYTYTMSENAKGLNKMVAELACKNGNGQGCTSLTQFIPRKLAKDKKLVHDLFMKACDLGTGFGCNQIADEFYHKNNTPKAMEYFKKACDLKYSLGCFSLSEYYKDMGKMEEHIKYKKISCDLDESKSDCK
ncbi:MAG: sel1 repeat family protein [Bacteriovorax sp.]|nr:sel1 repeat family protein [Bacteriovorax sp.]